MGLIISTPNVHTEGNLHNASLTIYEFAGNYDRKFFTIECIGTGAIVNISLSTTNGFRLFPCVSGSPIDYSFIKFNISSGAAISFSVDYDSTWGNETSVLLSADMDIYSKDGSTVILGPDNPIEFKVTSNKTLTKRAIASLLCKDEDGNYQVSQAGIKITEDETSFGIIRTNPKLTGNVKITVDSANDIWLNSIDAVKELADDKYKKYRIGKNSIYTVDINRFFDTGTTPPEIVYALYQNDEAYTSTQRTLDKQYDRFYQYGVESLKSKFYSEDFSFFAPLYLKTDVPQYFVIFRTDGAMNKFSYEKDSTEWASSITEEILSSSKIIKVFDLGETTPIGSYLRNIVNHPSRTESDLTVSYQVNGYTTFNGIAYNKGSFAQMGERLYDYYNVENPLIATEEFITLGMQRNKLVSSHVINLEFLFNDETAENYSINRYFGLYVNAIDLVNFDLNSDALQKYSLELGQTPVPRRGIDGNKLSQKSFVQTNSNGISIFAEALTIDRKNIVDDIKYFSSIVNIESSSSTSLTATLPGNYLNRISIDDNISFINSIGDTTSGIVSDINLADNITLLSVSIPTSIGVSTFFLSGLTHSCNFYTPEKAQLSKESLLNNSFIENQARFFYIKDNQNILHSVKSTEERIFTNDKFVNEKAIQINLKDTRLDMSNLSGFTNILTQTPVKTLENKGKSGISIEILDFFNNEDYIQIVWPLGPTNQGCPLRWKVVANDSYINPGEIWPDFALTSDNEGEYYLSYFNPGNNTIKLDTFVKSIENAFNIFPYKDFDVISKGSFLHFRSTQDGRSSDSLKIDIKSVNSVVKVMGVEAGSLSSFNFIGGSDRKYTRAKIENSIAAGMLQTEYVSTKGSFSALKQYIINTNIIIYTPYLDEPVYDISGKLVDFIDCDTHKIICIEDETHPIQLSSDGKLTTYELFKPSFGILSIMPLRDFDMDFHYSDYAKNYTPELREYFSRGDGAKEIATITNVLGNIYTFDKSYDFTEYTSVIGATVSIPFLSISKDGSISPILHNSDMQFGFTGPGYTATLLSASSNIVSQGDSIIFMPGDKHLYFKDNELVKFKGFLSLSGIVSSNDEENFKALENIWDPSRFYLHAINSEYDRLEENYLKTLVLKSRVVPYINKWVSPQGKDIRDNPYRLNYHRSFGNMCFSPSEEMNIPDPKYHTHEWPYLDSVPDKYPIAEFPENAFSYMFDSLSSIYDFSSLDRDWFSEYFTTGYPTEQYFDNNKQQYVSAKLDSTEKYAYFNYQSYNDTTTSFFRGHRFSINEMIEDEKVKLSTKYNSYRFSSIIESIEDDSFTFISPVTFTTIVNEKFKFIVLKITVRTSSYRYTNGNLRYVDLYTLSNSDEIGNFEYDNNLLTLKSYRDVLPTDRKISTPINFVMFSSTNEYAPFNQQFVDISSEILTLETGNYSRLIATKAAPGNILITLSNVVGTTKTNVKMQNNICHVKSTLATINTIPSGMISYWPQSTVYHQGGGNLSYSGVRDQLSFAEIMKVIKGSSDRKNDMKYLIYAEDGTLSTTANFSIDSISPEKLTRIYDYYPVNDNDKPQEFYTVPQISVNLEQQKDLQTIYRYQGDFAPKFRNVLKFWVREDEYFTDVLNEDFLLNNTHIGTELVDFSLLRNQYFTKVADNEVLKLSPDGGYQPVYPFINEIVIDKKNDFAWNSSWDNFYYRKYSSTSDYVDLKGTLQMKEIKSYLGSKSMKVPGQFDLYQFKFIKGTKSNFASLSDNELSYYEDSKNAYIQVNIYNRLLREMMTTVTNGTTIDYRAKTEFLKTMNLVSDTFTLDTIDSYVQKYLEYNIIELFDITNINLYVLQTGNSGVDQISTVTPVSSYRPIIENDSTIINMNVTLSETELIAKNYTLRNDVKITNTGNLKFLITYPLDSRFFISLSLGVVVKRI